MREWRETHRQLALLAREQGLQVNREPAEVPAIHKAILAGYLGQVATRYESREYLATRNRKVMIFPGSSVAKASAEVDRGGGTG